MVRPSHHLMVSGLAATEQIEDEENDAYDNQHFHQQ